MHADPTFSARECHDLRQLALKLVARELGVDPAEVRGDRPWTEYGLDSLSALVVAGDLEEALSVDLPSTLLWDCRTLDELALGLQRVLRDARRPAAVPGLALA